MAGRAYSTEAIVLRSIRIGEADRVLHLYTRANGRVGAVAKGVRKTMSRFGGRLELLSHVELVLHRGRSDLETVTGVQLVDSHHETREDYYRFSVGMIGAEAMLRLFPEQEANERAFGAVTRFLELLDESPHAAGHSDARPARPRVPAQAVVALWLSAARVGLCRVRSGGRAARRLRAEGRRRGLRAVRRRRRRRSRSRPTASPGSPRSSRSRSPTPSRSG